MVAPGIILADRRAPRASHRKTQEPKAVVDRLNEAVSRIASQADVVQLWAKQGAVPLVMNAEVFDKYARDDIAKWARVIKTAGIKAD